MVATVPLSNFPEGSEVSRWYALHTMSYCEAKVAGYLGAFGIEVFLPDYLSRRQWNDRVKMLRRPLFPGYLFGRFHRKLPIEALGGSGLVHIVGFAGSPMPIPDEEIESIRRLVDSGLHLYGSPMLKVGKHVRMCSGPLKGVEGRLEKIKSQFRLVVSVQLLCRSVSAEVDRESIEVLS
jgi:transcriptional antiterminator NusG